MNRMCKPARLIVTPGYRHEVVSTTVSSPTRVPQLLTSNPVTGLLKIAGPGQLNRTGEAGDDVPRFFRSSFVLHQALMHPREVDRRLL